METATSTIPLRPTSAGTFPTAQRALSVVYRPGTGQEYATDRWRVGRAVQSFSTNNVVPYKWGSLGCGAVKTSTRRFPYVHLGQATLLKPRFNY
jgi:hypothetical protein